MQLIEPGVDMLDTMNDRRIDADYVDRQVRRSARKARRRARADGRQRRQCPRRPGHRPQDRAPADQRLRQPRSGAGRDRQHQEAQAQAVADRPCRQWRGCRASWCGSNAMPRCPNRSRTSRSKGIPPEPLREFLEDMGFKALLARMVGGGAAGSSAGQCRRRHDVGAGRARRGREDHRRPHAVRDGDQRGSARPLDRRGAAPGLCRGRYRDRLHRLHRRAAGRDQPCDRSPTRPATSPSATAAATCCPKRRASCRATSCWRKLKPLLEDPAVLKIGHNLKYDWVMFAKAGIAVAPYDDTLVMSFDLDAGRSGHGMDELAKTHFEHECITLQVDLRGRRQADHLRQGAARRRHRICRRGRRHHAAPVAAAQAARRRRRRDARLRNGRPAAGRDDRADGAARGQGRPRLSRQVVAAPSRPKSPSSRARSTRPREGPFTIGSPQQLGRGAVRPARPQGRAQGQERAIFDRRHRARAARRRGRAGGAAGARMAPAVEAEVDLHRRAPGADQSRDGARPHQLQPVGGADRAAVVDRAQSAEHPDPHRDRAPDPRRLRRRAGPCADERRLQPDRASPRRAHGRRAAVEGGVRAKARTSTT